MYFTDAALKEECVVETIWMVYVVEPSQGLYINFKDLAGKCRDPLILLLPKTSLVNSLIKAALYQSGVVCLFLQCFLTLYGGPVIELT